MAEPKNTVKAYKLFRVHSEHPGKLFPLFVDANTPVEMNKWVDAKEGEMKGNKVKSKIGDLAYRPGWHAGDLPIATHIGEKSHPSKTAPDRRPANHAWAEVEMPNDVDWQSEATKRGTNPQGRVVPVKAHITDQIPVGGHYRYKTNPNMTGNWLIGGSMKVNKVLSDAEVARINKAAGMADLPRSQPFNKKTFGFASGGCVAPKEWKTEEHVNYKAQGGTVNPFDYENPEHVYGVASHMAKHKDFSHIPDVVKHLGEILSEGSYKHIEDPRMQQAMRKMGHDSYFVHGKEGKQAHRMTVYKATGGSMKPTLAQMKLQLAKKGVIQKGVIADPIRNTPVANSTPTGGGFVTGGGGPPTNAEYAKMVAYKKAQDAAEQAKLDAFQIASSSPFYKYTQDPSLIPHFHNESDADAMLRVKKNAMEQAENESRRANDTSSVIPGAQFTIGSGTLFDKNHNVIPPGPNDTNAVVTLADGTSRYVTKAEAAQQNKGSQQWMQDNGYVVNKPNFVTGGGNTGGEYGAFGSKEAYDKAVADETARRNAEQAKLDKHHVAPDSPFYAAYMAATGEQKNNIKYQDKELADRIARRTAISQMGYGDGFIANGDLMGPNGRIEPNENELAITVVDANGRHRYQTKAEAAEIERKTQQYLIDHGNIKPDTRTGIDDPNQAQFFVSKPEVKTRTGYDDPNQAQFFVSKPEQPDIGDLNKPIGRDRALSSGFSKDMADNFPNMKMELPSPFLAAQASTPMTGVSTAGIPKTGNQEIDPNDGYQNPGSSIKQMQDDLYPPQQPISYGGDGYPPQQPIGYGPEGKQMPYTGGGVYGPGGMFPSQTLDTYTPPIGISPYEDESKVGNHQPIDYMVDPYRGDPLAPRAPKDGISQEYDMPMKFAIGGGVQPNVAQMRMALMQKKNSIDNSNIGVNEAPDMSPKMYMAPADTTSNYPAPGGVATPQGMPIGGVDMNQQQPGQQLAPQPPQPPQQPGQPPQGEQPQGAGVNGINPPTGTSQGPSLNPSQGNILQMTPQGQTLAALNGGQPKPPGMKSGGHAHFSEGGNKGKKPTVAEMKQAIFDQAQQRLSKPSEILGKHEGKYLHITEADRAKVEKRKHGMRGGVGFSQIGLTDPEYAGRVWGVGKPGTGMKLLNRQRRGLLPEDQSIYSTFIGTPEMHTSNQLVFNRMWNKFQEARKAGLLDPEQETQMLDIMRSAMTKATKKSPAKPIFEQDASFDNSHHLFDTFERRRILSNLMSGKQVGGKKGQIFDASKMIEETTDPRLLHAPTLSVGPHIFSLSGERSYEPHLNPAFPHMLHGETSPDAFQQIPFAEAAPDYVKQIMQTKGRKPGYMDIVRNIPRQHITEEYLTGLQKKGRKKGGAVSMDVMQLELTKRKKVK